jgi:hypothetical protein
VTRLCDMTIGDLEQRVEATSLTLTAEDRYYDVDPEELAEWLEAEAYTASLVDPTVWIDADLVTSDDVGQVAA